MSTLWRAISSSVGTKAILALSGLALVAYLILHLVGNLFVFLGPAVLNGWGHTLISNPLVIPAEIGLLLIFLIHIYKAALNWLDNRRARPQGYVQKKWAGHTSRKNVGSATMIYTGLAIVVFVGLHVASFKYGAFYEPPEYEPGVRDLYGLVTGTFRNPAWAGFYVLCLVLVGLHLRHGVASAFQSLGADGPRFTSFIRLAGYLLGVLLAAGFAIIPIWFYFRQG
jgi:succinate dehydrogenase / fumarate reductase cytochrome b subunit